MFFTCLKPPADTKMKRFSLILWAMLCLNWTTVQGASTTNGQKRYQPSSRLDATLQAAMRTLWKTFPANVRIEENFLFFPVPFVRDVAFIESLLNDNAREKTRPVLPLYLGVEEDLRGFENELRNVTVNNVRFKSILYTNSVEFNKTMDATVNRVYKSPADPTDRALVVVDSGAKKRRLWNLLSQGVEENNLASTCEVRFCAIWKIIASQPSFSMVTLASLEIRDIAGFQWTEMVKFLFYDIHTIDVLGLQSVAKYDYAEFKYPRLNGCTGRALRMSYSSDFHLTFVIPSTKRNCSTLEELWKNFGDVNLNDLKFNNQEMFISIPVFRVSSLVNLRWSLKGSDLAKEFNRNSSKIYKALAFLATEFIFEPKLPPAKARPTIPIRTPEFLVYRPFFLSVAHISSRSTVFTGLVLYPGCVKQCLNQPITAGPPIGT